MKLIGAGLPRTATNTQSIALEMLGLPCYHMQQLLKDMSKSTDWHRAVDAHGAWTQEDWEGNFFAGYDSTVDWPAAFFYRELIDAYPDAKVLLSVRDADSWERSMRETVCAIYFGETVMHHVCQARYQIDPDFRNWYDLMVKMSWTGRGAFAGSYAEREQLKDAMERWNDEVRSTVPADRLLEWHPKDGWEPLCEFLDVDVPDEPLPHAFDTEGFKHAITAGAIGSLSSWIESREVDVVAASGEAKQPATA